MKECKVKRGRGVTRGEELFFFLFFIFLFSFIRIRLPLPNVFVHTNWEAARLRPAVFEKRARLHRGRKQGGGSQSSVCNVD